MVRRAAWTSGFDESMRVAEDVDLVWRTAGDGWRVRYEPQAIVRHDHRTDVRNWLRPQGVLRHRGGAARRAARRRPSPRWSSRPVDRRRSPDRRTRAAPLVRPRRRGGVCRDHRPRLRDGCRWSASSAARCRGVRRPRLARRWSAVATLRQVAASAADAAPLAARRQRPPPAPVRAPAAPSRWRPSSETACSAYRRRPGPTSTPCRTSRPAASTTSPTAPACGTAPGARARRARCCRPGRGSTSDVRAHLGSSHPTKFSASLRYIAGTPTFATAPSAPRLRSSYGWLS